MNSAYKFSINCVRAYFIFSALLLYSENTVITFQPHSIVQRVAHISSPYYHPPLYPTIHSYATGSGVDRHTDFTIQCPSVALSSWNYTTIRRYNLILVHYYAFPIMALVVLLIITIKGDIKL